jgi:hypothetical protein
MNIPRLLISFVAAFVFIFFFEWLFHGIMLKGIYVESMPYRRPDAEFQAHFFWLVLGQAIIALMLACIYAQGFALRGVVGGVCLGLMLAITYIGGNFIIYAVQPLPMKLIGLWAVGGVVEMCIAGALVGAIYKPAGPAVVIKA